MEPGDIIIDGGNSHYPDSIRRCKELEAKGFLFVGSGVSGGEEGARHGPSLMPGGSTAAWPHIKQIFQKTAAQAYGEPCCDWVGETGSGHYVKMVHNGIEYGDMQLIAEAYDILKRGLGLSESEIADTIAKWNKGVLDSFLIEITANILKFNDSDGEPVVNKILDKAGQKGTGKWTAIAALDAGMPVTLIGEAVFARCLSAIKEERVRASKVLVGPLKEPFRGDKQQFIDDLEQALYASKIISYTQGFLLMRETAKEMNWNLNYAGIARMWRGGCIIKVSTKGSGLPGRILTHDPYIQSVFLKDITAAYDKTPKLESLLFDDFFNKGEWHPSGIVLTSEYSFLDSDPQSAARLEARCRTEHSMGYTNAGFHHRAVVLRRLQERDCPCQPAAGATRLLRCSHFPRPARQGERALRLWREHPCVFLPPSRQRVGNLPD